MLTRVAEDPPPRLRLHPDDTVRRLTQQVEMAAVPCGFLDHVHEGEAEREVHALATRRIVEIGSR